MCKKQNKTPLSGLQTISVNNTCHTLYGSSFTRSEGMTCTIDRNIFQTAQRSFDLKGHITVKSVLVLDMHF